MDRRQGLLLLAVMSMCVASPVSDAYKRGFEMGYSAQTRKPSEAPSNAPSASPTTGTPTRESEAPSNAPSTAPATATAPTEKQSTKPEISVTPSAKRASQSLPTGKAPSSQKECDKRGAFLFESWKLAGKLKCPTGFSITKGTAVNKHIYKHGVCTSIRSMVCQCSASPNGCPRAKCKEYKIEQDPKTLLVTGYGVTGSAFKALFHAEPHSEPHGQNRKAVIKLIDSYYQTSLKVRTKAFEACKESIEKEQATSHPSKNSRQLLGKKVKVKATGPSVARAALAVINPTPAPMTKYIGDCSGKVGSKCVHPSFRVPKKLLQLLKMVGMGKKTKKLEKINLGTQSDHPEDCPLPYYEKTPDWKTGTLEDPVPCLPGSDDCVQLRIPGSRSWPQTKDRCTTDNPLVQQYFSVETGVRLGKFRNYGKFPNYEIARKAIKKAIEPILKAALPGRNLGLKVNEVKGKGWPSSIIKRIALLARIANGAGAALLAGAPFEVLVRVHNESAPTGPARHLLGTKEIEWTPDFRKYDCDMKFMAWVSLMKGTTPQCTNTSNGGELCEPYIASTVVPWMQNEQHNRGWHAHRYFNGWPAQKLMINTKGKKEIYDSPGNNKTMETQIELAVRQGIAKYRFALVAARPQRKSGKHSIESKV